MNSMLEDVLAREGSAPAFEDSRVDAELEEMLSKMRTNIKIIGLGGGGCNTIGRVYNEGIVGAELYACNTDAQHLLHIASPKKVLLGRRITKGLGAGALPQIGEEAAREAEEELRAIVQGADIVFVTCGLGGGTGTGSCGYVARLAKEMGALTIAVVTLPFRGEGKLRMESAEWGLERLRDAADTVITIPNDKLLDLVPRQSLNLAFKFADEVLMRSIEGLSDRADHLGRDRRRVARTHVARHARRDRRQVEADCRATGSLGGEGPRRRRRHPLNCPVAIHGRRGGRREPGNIY